MLSFSLLLTFCFRNFERFWFQWFFLKKANKKIQKASQNQSHETIQKSNSMNDLDWNFKISLNFSIDFQIQSNTFFIFFLFNLFFNIQKKQNKKNLKMKFLFSFRGFEPYFWILTGLSILVSWIEICFIDYFT